VLEQFLLRNPMNFSGVLSASPPKVADCPFNIFAKRYRKEKATHNIHRDGLSHSTNKNTSTFKG
jgi:hypothetical protein